MFKKYIIAACLCIFLQYAFAQQDQKQLAALSDIDSIIAFGEIVGKNSFEDVIEKSESAIDRATALGYRKGLGLLHHNIGRAQYFKGDYPSAAGRYFKAIAILEKSKYQLQLAEVYNSLAKLYRKTRDLPKAHHYYNLAMNLYKGAGDVAGTAMIFNEWGVVYEYEENFKKAEEFYRNSLNINQKLNNPEGVGYALGNLSGVFTIQKKYEEAEKYLMQALTLRKTMEDSFDMALTYADLGGTFSAAGKPKKAIEYFDSAIYLASKLKYAELLSASYYSKSKAFELLSDPASALLYLQKHKSIADSIFNSTKAKDVEELNLKYETGKKENKILQQELELRSRNNTITIISLIFIALAMVGYLMYRRNKRIKENEYLSGLQNEKIKSLQASIAAEEAERNRIAGQLHDGVGQLMSVVKMNLSAYAHSKNSGQADAVKLNEITNLVDTACKEVRNVSHMMVPADLLGGNFPEALKKFLDKISSDGLYIHVTTSGFDNKPADDYEKALYRIIQECTNNVLKHAEANNLDITVNREHDQLSATLEDDGKGFDASENSSESEGVGLRSIRARLAALNGHFELSTKPGEGTMIAIWIPCT